VSEIRRPNTFPVPGQVEGLRVVVTGATRGLGLIIADAFARAGARLCLVARDSDALERVALSFGGVHLTVPGDVTDPEVNDSAADLAVERWGGLDVWIANAGISPLVAGPLETPPDTWRRVIDVNLTGPFLGARAAARVMGEGGTIIITSSVLGERPRTGLSAYSASKAGVIGLVKALALDLADRGITVNAVSPGWFDSPLTEGWRLDRALEKGILAHTALGRWGQAEDLAGAYLFLASPAGGFMTGSVVTVDGGYLCV